MTADRFKLQQSWWIASEIARRHQGIWVDRFMADESGPVLVAYRHEDELRVFFDLQHGVRLQSGAENAQWGWDKVFSLPGAHDLLRRIETTSVLGIPKGAPASSGHSLVYRLISRMQTMHVDSARPWVAVPVSVQPMVQGHAEPQDDPLINGFASVHSDIHSQRLQVAQQFDDVRRVGTHPWLWAMTRDVETELVLDTDGFVHMRRTGAHQLLKWYDEVNRDIDRLAVRVLESAGVTRR